MKSAVIHEEIVSWQLINGQQREKSLSFPDPAGHSVLQFLDTLFVFSAWDKAHYPHWRWLTYVRGKKGASFGVQLPRDGMKILQWPSNPKLPSENIPLPPRRDPDLFACRAEQAEGELLRTGTRWRQTGSGRWEERSGATHLQAWGDH